MPDIRRKSHLATAIEDKRGLLAHGDGVAPHRHTDGQLLYPSAGVLATTLAELGRTVGASERTLSRLFRTELGMGFHRWRSLLRVQHALVGLVEGDAVIDTATRLGWANPTSFIEAFTAIVGQTPGRYQTELRRGDR
ncbi:helix-turn-helix transcriptional regulator [Streptomyces sp. NPDC051173]|uniref:helix-turn-helix transcriptional regulator n=1 Tax=Streptomyces sp. NPDC051173 TaxID=3155164 RepID=UPI00344EB09D